MRTAEGRRQKAEGRRQKAEGRRQKAEPQGAAWKCCKIVAAGRSPAQTTGYVCPTLQLESLLLQARFTYESFIEFRVKLAQNFCFA
jgi:hypothetical protein